MTEQSDLDDGDFLASMSGSVPLGSAREPFPAELKVDDIPSKGGMRAAIWRRVNQVPGMVSRITENDLHLVGRTIPGGRAALYGGATVLAVAGVGGGILLCRSIYKRHINEIEHKKSHQKISKKNK